MNNFSVKKLSDLGSSSGGKMEIYTTHADKIDLNWPEIPFTTQIKDLEGKSRTVNNVTFC